jgi:hypothetical protein
LAFLLHIGHGSGAPGLPTAHWLIMLLAMPGSPHLFKVKNYIVPHRDAFVLPQGCHRAFPGVPRAPMFTIKERHGIGIGF